MMKRVAFKVASALKEAGYKFIPAPASFFTDETNSWFDNEDGELYSLPTYLEVWLWLWRQQKYRILLSASNQRWNEVNGIVTGTDGEVCGSYHRGIKAYDATNHNANWNDPEEAIVNAIDYLVNNDLIK